MMKAWQIAKRIIQAFVLVVVLFYVTLFLVMGYQYYREPVVDFDDSDVQFVLGWAKQEGKPSQLIHSYHPSANWAGDYEKIFALRLQPGVVNDAAHLIIIQPQEQVLYYVAAKM